MNEPDTRLPWTKPDGALVALLAVLSALYVLPLFAGGEWFVSHEMKHALTRLLEYDAALRGGQIPPRWCDNLMAGHGYPLFQFFPPFSFAVAEVFALAGASLPVSWKLATVVFRFAGVAGMYGLLRHRAGRVGAALGALLFLVAQYPACTLYVRGNLQEFAALNVWPLAFWGVEAVARRRRFFDPAVPLAAMALGALATTHMLTTYMAAFHLLAFGGYLLIERIARGGFSARRTGRDVMLAVGTGALALAVCAWFVVPAIVDFPQTRHAVLTEWTRYEDHFLAWWQLVRPTWGYGLSMVGTEQDGMPFDVGAGVWVAIAGGVVLAVARRRIAAVFPLVMFVATAFGTTYAAAPLWRVWPSADFLQFPWRLLIPTTFWGCFFAAVAMGPTLESLWQKTRGRVACIALISLPFFFLAPNLRPLLYYQQDSVVPIEALRYILTNTMTGEYLPLAVESDPPAPSNRTIRFQDSTRVLSTEPVGSASYIALADVPVGARSAYFDVYWFPGWRVQVDGVDVTTHGLAPYGYIAWEFTTPGEHEVRIRYTATRLARVCDLISLFGLLACVAWAIASARRDYSEEGEAANASTTESATT